MIPGSFARLRALIVEDNAHMRMLLKSLLRSLELAEIYEASDGAEAFDELRAMRPDFVLSDLHMMPVNGLEFTRRVRNDPTSPCRHIPIIMITAHTERRYIEAARDVGVTEILVKPVTPRDLVSRIVEIIDWPRPFVRSTDYFGPDRRRHDRDTYQGPLRRAEDAADGSRVDFR